MVKASYPFGYVCRQTNQKRRIRVTGPRTGGRILFSLVGRSTMVAAGCSIFVVRGHIKRTVAAPVPKSAKVQNESVRDYLRGGIQSTKVRSKVESYLLLDAD